MSTTTNPRAINHDRWDYSSPTMESMVYLGSEGETLAEVECYQHEDGNWYYSAVAVRESGLGCLGTQYRTGEAVQLAVQGWAEGLGL